MGILNFFTKQKPSKNITNKPLEPANRKRKAPSWVDAQYIEDPLKKEKYLLDVEDQCMNDPINLHFTYNLLIDLYYKRRNDWPEALDKCINICKKDIELFPRFIKAEQEEHNDDTIPRIPSFQRLAIIYENQGKIKEAISICEKAICYKLTDNTKGGFEGRIKKLEKKIQE